MLNDSLEAVKSARESAGLGDANKAITQATGIVNYDLQQGMIQTYPFTKEMTFLGASIPRVDGRGDTATRWKAVTGINTSNTHLGLSEGNRGASVVTSTANLSSNYTKFGLEDSVTFEADYAAEGFDDPKALAMSDLLRAFLLQQEKQLLWGNASNALGTTPTPTVANAASGGSIAAATYNVACVALTADGADRSSVASGVVQQLTKTNVDGTTDTINGGAAQKSATAATTTSGSTSVVTASVVAVDGAVSYAWFIGTSGNEKLVAITAINSVSITALPSAGNQALSALASADYSADANYNTDGIFTYARASLNATVVALATGTAGVGTKLTASGAGTVTEIDSALATFYDTWKFCPNKMLVSMPDYRNIANRIVNNGGAPLARVVQNAPGGQNMIGGIMPMLYLAPNGQVIDIIIHPFMKQGTIILYTDVLPYAGSGIGSVMRVKTRKEIYATEWPLRTRKWEYGVYADMQLQHQAPFSLLKITNIAAG